MKLNKKELEELKKQRRKDIDLWSEMEYGVSMTQLINEFSVATKMLTEYRQEIEKLKKEQVELFNKSVELNLELRERKDNELKKYEIFLRKELERVGYSDLFIKIKIRQLKEEL